MNTDIHKARHSLAHVLATAVLQYDPQAKLAIGPATDTGFYYDFELSKKITDEELPQLEDTMREILKKGFTPECKTVTYEEAKALFKDQPYKLELIESINADGEKITVYTLGEFVDLCEGPHVKESNDIDPQAFKLTSIAGAYWRGDENNQMLTRIYGLAFSTKKELKTYIQQLKEAKKRDHRKLGKELDLFTFSPLVGSGLPLWTPKGTILRNAVIDKIFSLQKKFGYQPVTIPHITKKDLYVTSGHWEKFGDELFKVQGQSDTQFVMKPMNCPHHTQIYASKPRSYKDLPIRYTETTMVYRDEKPGELLGLSRVRSISQDDGHVFCRPDQIEEEFAKIIQVIKEFYTALGMFKEDLYWVSVSVRDPETPEKYIGDTATWDKAEATLEAIAKKEGFPYKVVEGEAAFYGPKIDFMFKDAIGREWQLATAQLDLNMPERFNLEYTNKNGKKEHPVIIHRAIAGSLERFLSVMIEHFAGAFPFWMSPVQVAIIPIAEEHTEYAEAVMEELTKKGIRYEFLPSTDALGKRIRETHALKVPYTFVIGSTERENSTVTVESRDEGKLGELSLEEFYKKIEYK